MFWFGLGLVIHDNNEGQFGLELDQFGLAQTSLAPYELTHLLYTRTQHFEEN